jgi:hypothetical protein
VASEATPDDLADGMALWQEHKPQSAEDWVAVAERWLAAGESTERSSPLFAALVLAVRQRDGRLAVEDVRAASDHVHENPPARCGVEYEVGWQDACEAIDRRLGLNTDNGGTNDG